MMKESKSIIEFYINIDNMTEVLNGKRIVNFDEMHHNLFTNLSKHGSFYPVYESRKPGIEYKSEYPDINDRIVGKVTRYMPAERNRRYPALEIEWGDALYIAKLENPCIKLNGYFYETEDGNLIMDEITRITLSSR